MLSVASCPATFVSLCLDAHFPLGQQDHIQTYGAIATRPHPGQPPSLIWSRKVSPVCILLTKMGTYRFPLLPGLQVTWLFSY